MAKFRRSRSHPVEFPPADGATGGQASTGPALEGPEHEISGRTQANPGARLLLTAKQLFYEQGYQSAGINEIIERSETSKKSFYNYFPSKRVLGEATLRAEEQDLHRMMNGLIRRYSKDYAGFVTAWARALKRAARCDDYNGCAFANTAAQAPEEFRELLRDIARDWLDQLGSFLMQSDLALDERKAKDAGAKLLMQYEGAVQMWKLTGDLTYFDRFAEVGRRIPELLE